MLTTVVIHRKEAGEERGSQCQSCCLGFNLKSHLMWLGLWNGADSLRFTRTYWERVCRAFIRRPPRGKCALTFPVHLQWLNNYFPPGVFADCFSVLRLGVFLQWVASTWSWLACCWMEPAFLHGKEQCLHHPSLPQFIQLFTAKFIKEIASHTLCNPLHPVFVLHSFPGNVTHRWLIFIPVFWWSIFFFP